MEPTEENLRAWEAGRRRRGELPPRSPGLPGAVRRALPDLADKRVLHLRCETGDQTVELARLGALVSGVDSSAEALAVARRRDPSIAWVQADVHSLPAELRRGRFDVVYSGAGATDAPDDLDGWAAGAAAGLRRGGVLIAHDTHPILACLDALLRWRDDYFAPGFPGLGRALTAVAAAGLVVRQLDEVRSLDPYRRRDARVPAEYVLVADKLR